MMERGGVEALNGDPCHCKLAKNEESKHDVDQIAGKLGSVEELDGRMGLSLPDSAFHECPPSPRGT